MFCLQSSPPPTLGVGSKGQNSTSSEYGHVAYQVKGNEACCNNYIVTNTLNRRPPRPPNKSMKLVRRASPETIYDGDSCQTISLDKLFLA